jgi:hypothetical protein
MAIDRRTVIRQAGVGLAANGLAAASSTAFDPVRPTGAAGTQGGRPGASEREHRIPSSKSWPWDATLRVIVSPGACGSAGQEWVSSAEREGLSTKPARSVSPGCPSKLAIINRSYDPYVGPKRTSCGRYKKEIAYITPSPMEMDVIKIMHFLCIAGVI